ncbi:hypothetical protein GCM10009647_019960 [Streptomyces sanglieri]
MQTVTVGLGPLQAADVAAGIARDRDKVSREGGRVICDDELCCAYRPTQQGSDDLVLPLASRDLPSSAEPSVVVFATILGRANGI